MPFGIGEEFYFFHGTNGGGMIVHTWIVKTADDLMSMHDLSCGGLEGVFKHELPPLDCTRIVVTEDDQRSGSFRYYGFPEDDESAMIWGNNVDYVKNLVALYRAINEVQKARH